MTDWARAHDAGARPVWQFCHQEREQTMEIGRDDLKVIMEKPRFGAVQKPPIMDAAGKPQSQPMVRIPYGMPKDWHSDFLDMVIHWGVGRAQAIKGNQDQGFAAKLAFADAVSADVRAGRFPALLAAKREPGSGVRTNSEELEIANQAIEFWSRQIGIYVTKAGLKGSGKAGRWVHADNAGALKAMNRPEFIVKGDWSVAELVAWADVKHPEYRAEAKERVAAAEARQEETMALLAQAMPDFADL